jgi:hypothetical protein
MRASTATALSREPTKSIVTSPSDGRVRGSHDAAWRALTQPVEKSYWIAYGRGEGEPLDATPGESLKAFDERKQVPATIVTGEGMQLINHDQAQLREQRPVVYTSWDEHRLERLGRREQDVGWWPQNLTARRIPHVAVP